MEIDRDAILQTFFAEADEHLAGMQEALLALELRPADAEALGTVFRGAHTLKGNSASLGFGALTDMAHALEDLLERVRAQALALTPDLVTLLLQGLDALQALVRAAAAGHDQLAPGQRDLIEDLLAANVARQDLTPVLPVSRSSARARTLRVDVARLDRLLDLAGEIAIARGRVAQLLEQGGQSPALDAHREADRLFLDVQELVLQARMVPLGPVFRAFARTVRDMAATLDKQAHLVVEGEDVEVDTSVVEHLRDPLTHMLRNALDHGIEAPAVREARGKHPVGCIRLKAFREAGSLVVELSDDGAGLDLERIAERARAHGRVAESSRPGPAELQQLIFEAGFSTAAEVTDVSGRGVGMDVVRRNVLALRGSVTVRSRAGGGTTFVIRLPLTLAIIEGFGVQAGDETYVLPLDTVSECLDLPGELEFCEQGRAVLFLRGAPLPCLRLRRHFGLAGTPLRECVVVVQHDGGQAGLVVDGLLGGQQTVIKPLGALLKRIPGVAGSAILGSGRVALILDVPALLRELVCAPPRAIAGFRTLKPRPMPTQTAQGPRNEEFAASAGTWQGACLGQRPEESR